MKASTGSSCSDKARKSAGGRVRRFLSAHPRLEFAALVLGFYVMMMALFLYHMLANLSSAPKFVYTQF